MIAIAKGVAVYLAVKVLAVIMIVIAVLLVGWVCGDLARS